MYHQFFENIKKGNFKNRKEPINLNNLEKDRLTGEVFEIEYRPDIITESKTTILANNLFRYVKLGIEPNGLTENYELKCEVRKYTNRTDQLLRSIELIPHPNTAVEFEIIADCYFYLGAKYRLKSLETYLIKQNKFGLKGMEILNFAQVLEKEYFFEEAKVQYLEMIKGNPMFQGYYTAVSSILRKQNRLDDAIEFLNQAKELEYYVPYRSKYSLTGVNEDFKNVIDSNLEKLTSMKKRGYVYTPRNRKKQK